MNPELDQFTQDLIQDVLATAEAELTTLPEAFTSRVVEHLSEAGELEDATVCHHSARGVQASGYAITPDGQRLDILVTDFRQDRPGRNLTHTDLETLVRRARTLAHRCHLGGYTRDVDDALPAYEMIQQIQHAMRTVSSVRIIVCTDAIARTRTLPVEAIGDITFACQVWDIERLHRMLTSGTLQEPIDVDFEDRFGGALPCLTSAVVDDDYSVLLAIVPATMLADLYGEYGTRLLQLNVRSFLQARGAVNKGLRETLRDHPERFLAYNNGISATAGNAELDHHADGSTSIRRLRDVQIVNGGQTTASIHAAHRDGYDLGHVAVQAKITVVKPERLTEIVSQISRYSNTQNKVTAADFTSNATYQVDIERLSRVTWAPSPAGDGQDTHWFYERARGQYVDESSRQGTPSRQRMWQINNPKRQKITKTDLAKYLNSYEGLPHLVSRGAEKNFQAFMLAINEQAPIVDVEYYRDVIAKSILFKEVTAIVTRQQYGGYRANIVAYTIARLVLSTEKKLNLEAIWDRQALSAALESAMIGLSWLVSKDLTSPPAGGNVGEWCKKPEAWDRVKKLSWSVPGALKNELID